MYSGQAEAGEAADIEELACVHNLLLLSRPANQRTVKRKACAATRLCSCHSSPGASSTSLRLVRPDYPVSHLARYVFTSVLRLGRRHHIHLQDALPGYIVRYIEARILRSRYRCSVLLPPRRHLRSQCGMQATDPPGLFTWVRILHWRVHRS